MKNLSYISIILLGTILLYHCKQAPESGNKDIVNSKSVKGNPSVEVVNPSIRSFNSDQVITGTIRADQSVYVHAMEKGMVSSINVDIGDKINRGQTIARLSNPVLTIELKEAEAKFLEANANLAAAKAELKMHQVEQKTAQSLFEKISSVYNKTQGLTTIVEFENAKREAEMATANLEVAEAKVNKEVANKNAVKLLVEGIQERVSMLTISAPFSGVVTGRFVDKGAMIQNALSDNDAKPLISIESIDPVRLILPIPESDISGIEKGDKVEIEFPSLAGGNITADISRISKSLDPASKTMEVQIDIPNKNGAIKTGMYAKAKIRRSSSDNALSLPNAAIHMKKDAPYVFVVKDGNVEEIQLKKGLIGKDYFQVLNSNIDAATQVIVKGKSMVKSGQAVQAILK